MQWKDVLTYKLIKIIINSYVGNFSRKLEIIPRIRETASAIDKGERCDLQIFLLLNMEHTELSPAIQITTVFGKMNWVLQYSPAFSRNITAVLRRIQSVSRNFFAVLRRLQSVSHNLLEVLSKM